MRLTRKIKVTLKILILVIIQACGIPHDVCAQTRIKPAAPIVSEARCTELEPLLTALARIVADRQSARENYRECRATVDSYSLAFGDTWALAPYYQDFCNDLREMSGQDYHWEVHTEGPGVTSGCRFSNAFAESGTYAAIRALRQLPQDTAAYISRRLIPDPDGCFNCAVALDSDGQSYATELLTTYPAACLAATSSPFLYHVETLEYRLGNALAGFILSHEIDSICTMQANTCRWTSEDFDLMKRVIRLAEARLCQIGDGQLWGVAYAERAIASAERAMQEATCTYP